MAGQECSRYAMTRQRRKTCPRCGQLVSTNGLAQSRHRQKHCREALRELNPQPGETLMLRIGEGEQEVVRVIEIDQLRGLVLVENADGRSRWPYGWWEPWRLSRSEQKAEEAHETPAGGAR